VLVTFVVRLLSDRLAAGELVGEVEHVGDGGHAIVRGTGDLLGFAQQAAAATAPPGPPEGASPPGPPPEGGPSRDGE
jgi:hypothetical protein